jgi:hypothetical protein
MNVRFSLIFNPTHNLENETTTTYLWRHTETGYNDEPVQYYQQLWTVVPFEDESYKERAAAATHGKRHHCGGY